VAREIAGLERRIGAGASVRATGRVEPGRRAMSDRGFTLIEILVALTIGALAVLLAHEIFAAVVDRGQALVHARLALDREVNARRWLEATFLSLDVGVDSAGGFEGRRDRVRFASWLRTPDGWFERRALVLGREQGRLIASVTPGDPIALLDNVTDLQLDYLLEPGAESRWVREWVSPVSAPVAVRLRVTRAREMGEGERAVVDTLLFLIQERG
jgi:prepilin-type N-terminal cleavage/methylation domain-containing protein